MKTDFRHNGYTLDDAVDALMAYDLGATDSGVKDEAMKDAVRNYLPSHSVEFQVRWASEFARDRYLSDAALAQGYGIGDVANLLCWLKNEIGVEFGG